MSKNKTIVWFLMIPLILVFANCGSKGNGEDTIYICKEPTDYYVSNSGTIAADLNGNYTLSGFDWDYYTAFGNLIKTITETDLQTALGDMTISPAWADLDYSLAGSVHLTRRWYIIYSDAFGSYTKGTVSWADTNSGIVDLDGVPSPFTASGDQLSITYPTWCFLLEETDVE